MSGRSRRASARERLRAAAVLGVFVLLHGLVAVLLVDAVHAEVSAGTADSPAAPAGAPAGQLEAPTPTETPAAPAYCDVLAEVFYGLPVMQRFERDFELRPLPSRHHNASIANSTRPASPPAT